MMRCLCRWVAVVCLGFLPVSLFGQRPLHLGTAAGVGLGAVTEARQFDALGWNPALLGVWDGPLHSASWLAVDIGDLPTAKGLRTVSDRTGFGGTPGRFSPWASAFPRGDRESGDLVVRWAAVQSAGLAVSLESRVLWETGGAKGVFGDSLEAGSRRASLSVGRVGWGGYLGRRIWGGASVEGLWVHQTGRSEVLTEGEDLADREILLEGIPGASLDVGLLARPLERLRFGAAVSDVLSGVWRSKHSPSLRTVLRSSGSVVDAGSLGSEVVGTETGREVEALWTGTGVRPVVRGGAALDLGSNGGVGFGISRPLEGEGWLSAREEPSRTVFVRLGGMRGSWGWGSVRQGEAAVRIGGCGRVVTLSAGRRKVSGSPAAFLLSGAISWGGDACQDLR